MKKLSHIIVCIALLVAFCACHKDQLGLYNPKMRIEKVYCEEGSRYLSEQWAWNGSALSKIDHFRPGGGISHTDTYQYDDKNRLTRIGRGDEYTEFLYDGKMLTTINTYSQNRIVETCRLTYDRNRLAHISIERPAKGSGGVSLLPFLIPGNSNLTERIFPIKDSKSEIYNYSSAEMDFHWDGDNVQYLRMRLARPDSIQRLTFTYIYDESLNPQNGFLSLLTDRSVVNDRPQYLLCNKNNVRNVLITDEYDVFSSTTSFTYSYECYKKFPTKIYLTTRDIETFGEDSTLICSYVYLQ